MSNKIKGIIIAATFVGVIAAYLTLLDESLRNNGANAEGMFFAGLGGAGTLLGLLSSIKAKGVGNKHIPNKSSVINYLSSDRVSITKKGNYKFE